MAGPSLPGLTLIRELGDGANGRVYLYQRADGSKVAAKLLPCKLADGYPVHVQARQRARRGLGGPAAVPRVPTLFRWPCMVLLRFLRV